MTDLEILILALRHYVTSNAPVVNRERARLMSLNLESGALLAEFHAPERTNADRVIPEPASNICPGCGYALDCIEQTYSCRLGKGCKCGSKAR